MDFVYTGSVELHHFHPAKISVRAHKLRPDERQMTEKKEKEEESNKCGQSELWKKERSKPLLSLGFDKDLAKIPSSLAILS